ncbi:MAG TPA: DUF4313 domain-containing protein [Burkholderiales bacterium]|nr:DUF4313 domain-containing protein [Burkholderiales bacterium]
MEVVINNTLCEIALKRYSNNRIAIVATDSLDGLPYCKATVNLVDASVNENETFLDTNNVPTILEDLIKANVVSEPIEFVQSGFCIYPKVKVLMVK